MALARRLGVSVLRASHELDIAQQPSQHVDLLLEHVVLRADGLHAGHAAGVKHGCKRRWRWAVCAAGMPARTSCSSRRWCSSAATSLASSPLLLPCACDAPAASMLAAALATTAQCCSHSALSARALLASSSDASGCWRSWSSTPASSCVLCTSEPTAACADAASEVDDAAIARRRSSCSRLARGRSTQIA